jgi:hypothetical protein
MHHDAANRSNKTITFAKGNKVWLSTEHLKLHNKPSKKFQQRYNIGPYVIVSKISNAAFHGVPKTRV